MEAKLACGRKARAVNLRNNFRQLHFVRHAMINLEVIADEEVVVGIQALPEAYIVLYNSDIHKSSPNKRGPASSPLTIYELMSMKSARRLQ